VLRVEPIGGLGGAGGLGGEVSGRRLRIDVHVVRGTGTVAAEAVPVEPSILIDLPRPS